MRRRASLVLLLLALAVAACGGDSAEDEREDAQDGAEATVRAYLTALVDRSGADACAKFTPEYRRSVLRQNRAFARENDVDDCPGLFDAIMRASPRVTFEGEPLRRETVGKLEFHTSVRQSGEEHNATVTGRHGRQRYELETREGRWFIVDIAQTG